MFKIRSSFFRVKKPKKFGYTPRYYDERKERREKMMARYENEGKEDNVSPDREARMREAFSSSRRHSGFTAQQEARSRMIRLAIILCTVILMVYWLIRKYGLWDQFFK